MTPSELQAENERLKAERDYCQRYYHDVVVEAKRLKAECDEALRSVQVLRESSAENLRLAVTREHERDEARAERDALTITSEEAGDIIRALTVERDEARAQAARLAEALTKDIRSGFIVRMDLPDYDEYVNPILASTDARKWLREEKVKELEQIATHYDNRKFPNIPVRLVQTYIRERIAELRREET